MRMRINSTDMLKFMLSVYLMVTPFLGDVHVSGKVGSYFVYT